MSVTSVKLMESDEGSRDTRDRLKARCVWRARCSAVTDTAFDVIGSNLLPRLGDPFKKWSRNADGTYSGTPNDADAVAVMLEPRRLKDDPRTWDVTVSYDGIKSPLATPPEIEYEDVPYQEQQVADVHGLVKTNSALDPYEEGTDVDRNRLRLTITRNIDYEDWNPDFLEGFKNSLNLTGYAHGGLVIPLDSGTSGAGGPVASPPGTAKLTSLTARRVLRSDNPDPLLAKYYWVVRAVIDFDYSVYTDNNGNEQLRRWRRVLIDAGHSERVNGRLAKFVSPTAGSTGVGPQLLDGAGRRLFLAAADPDFPNRPVFAPYAAPELPFVKPTTPGVPVPEHDWYACRAGQTLRVLAPGVLANDAGAKDGDTVVLTGSASHGTVTLDSDARGGFTYTPTPPAAGTNPFYGWDSFTYRVENGYGQSADAKVCILVGPVPKVRVFEDYHHKDWSEIAYLIGGW